MNKDIFSILNPKSNRLYIMDFKKGTWEIIPISARFQVQRIMGSHDFPVKDLNMFHRVQNMVKNKELEHLTTDNIISSIQIELGSAQFI